jgi:hypothetical protein
LSSRKRSAVKPAPKPRAARVEPDRGLDSLLASLPPEVLAIELHGWRCVRV